MSVTTATNIFLAGGFDALPARNHNCQQSDTCPARKLAEDVGEPFIGSTLDMALMVVAFVFAASCIGYAWGGWR